MDRVEFVVAEQELGIGPCECAEPTVNGDTLPDLLKRAERLYIRYAGLSLPRLREELQKGLEAPAAEPRRVQLLRCICGDEVCGSATVETFNEPGAVVWRNVRGDYYRNLDTGNRYGHPEDYTKIGPFRFDRGEYERALANPISAGAPVRDTSALAQLAHAVPRDHRRWLEALFMETATFPGVAKTREIWSAGLRAFAERGDAMTEADAMRWALEMHLSDASKELLKETIRAVGVDGQS